MGLIVDIVPNHMAASLENAWWVDVLRHGPDSRYARRFDIDWESEDPALRGKVFLRCSASPCTKPNSPSFSATVRSICATTTCCCR
jgi:(1->4)-alpha-D-glucan 1-alpha-D-glucosylmutase